MFRYSNWKISQLITRIINRFDPVTQGWLVVFTGNLARMTLGFFSSVLIARALGPAIFGVYAVLGAAMAIAGVIADGGLNASAVKRVSAVWTKSPDTARQRGQVAFWYRAAAAGIVFIIASALAWPISTSFLGLKDVSAAPFLFILSMAGMFFIAINGSINGLLQATSHFGRISVVNLTNAGLTTILAIVLVFTNQLDLITALVILGIGTTLVSIVVGTRFLPGRWQLLKIPPRLILHQEGLHLFRIGRWLWISSLFAVVTLQLDVILVNRLSVAASAGFYALALNLAYKADVVNQSLYTVLLPTASRLSGKTATRRYIWQSLARSIVVSLSLLLLIPLAQPLILTFYGLAYAPAIPLFQILILMVIFDVLTIPIILLTFPLNRPRLLAVADVVRAATLFIIALILIPAIGPIGAALAKIVAKVFGFLFILFFLLRRRSYPTQKTVQG